MKEKFSLPIYFLPTYSNKNSVYGELINYDLFELMNNKNIYLAGGLLNGCLTGL